MNKESQKQKYLPQGLNSQSETKQKLKNKTKQKPQPNKEKTPNGQS